MAFFNLSLTFNDFGIIQRGRFLNKPGMRVSKSQNRGEIGVELEEVRPTENSRGSLEHNVLDHRIEIENISPVIANIEF
jgi:hypothetical protein